MVNYIQLTVFICAALSLGKTQEHKNAGPEIAQRPVYFGSFDPSEPLQQRPLDGQQRLILACSIPKGQACQTGRGKDLHNYCTCGEGLECVDQICQSVPAYKGATFKGTVIRVKPTSSGEGYEPWEEESYKSSEEAEIISEEPIVQRPVMQTPSKSRRIAQLPLMQRPIEQRPVQRPSAAYFSGSEVQDTESRLPIDIVQRPVDGFGREIMPDECRLPAYSNCGMPRKALDGYCNCAIGYYCHRWSNRPGGTCLPEIEE